MSINLKLKIINHYKRKKSQNEHRTMLQIIFVDMLSEDHIPLLSEFKRKIKINHSTRLRD